MPDLDSKLQGSAVFVQAEADQDVVQLLLVVIRGYCCRFDNHQQSTYALKQANHQVSMYYQAHDMTNTEYVEQFNALVGVVETYGDAYGQEPGLMAMELVAQGVRPEDVDSADWVAIIKAEEVCRKCYLSCMLIRGADNGRYFQLKVDLSNDMTKGADNYPKTIVETMRLLTNYVPPPRLQHVRDPDSKGLAFILGEGGTLRGPKSKGEVECWHCGGPYFKSDCPELKLLDTGVQNLNINDCSKEHSLFSADDGYGLVQKQAKGV